MSIPKSFKLLDQTFTVAIVDDLAFAENASGQTRYRENLILIQGNVPGWPISRERQEQVFWHELMHLVLSLSKNDKLSDDEDLVDLCASLIHQAITTATFEEETPCQYLLSSD